MAINIIKSGIVIQQWPLDAYQVNVMNGLSMLVDKESRKTVVIFSPTFYDYIEIEEEQYNVQPNG